MLFLLLRYLSILKKKGKTILLKLQKVAKTLRGAFSSYAKLILKFIGFKDLLILNI